MNEEADQALKVVEAPTIDKPVWKRNMVRAAILLAYPVKG